MKNQGKSQYHHGDLRLACLKEGMRLLKKGGSDSIGMREIALRVGVSPRAPYRHFKDKLELLAGLAEEGFIQFTETLKAALEGPFGRGKNGRLGALASGYVEFALKNPRLMELMFSEIFNTEKNRFPSLEKAGSDAFLLLKNEVQSIFPQSRLSVDELTVAAWSLVHGYSNLLHQKQLESLRMAPGKKDAMLSTLVGIFLRGVAEV